MARQDYPCGLVRSQKCSAFVRALSLLRTEHTSVSFQALVLLFYIEPCRKRYLSSCVLPCSQTHSEPGNGMLVSKPKDAENAMEHVLAPKICSCALFVALLG